MFQILLVDDHEHLVESMARSIPWEELGIAQVHKAYSGQGALDVLDTYPVDIMITDIRMPGMSGLELIEQIQQRRKRIKCILLSGYADFEYAKQAIQSHAVDYILKPAEDEEIITCLRKAAEAIRKEWEEVSSQQRTLHTLRENFPKLRDGLLAELLAGRAVPPAVLEKQLQSLELPFRLDDEVNMLLVRLDEPFYAYSRDDFYLMEYAIGNIAEEIFRDAYDIWRCRDVHDYLIFLIKARDALPQAAADGSDRVGGDSANGGGSGSFRGPMQRQPKLEREASEIQDAVRTFLHGTVSILISDQGRFPQDVPQLYQASLGMIRQRFGQDGEFLISSGAFGDALPVDSSSGLHDTPTLVQLLEAGRWDAIEEKLESVFSSIAQLERHTYQEHVMEVTFTVGSALISICHKNGKRLEAIIGEDFGALLQPAPFRSVEQLREWTARVLGRVQADIHSGQGETTAYFVRRAQEYVEHNLAGDTSLQAVADFVCLHPVYLSRVYKSETGEGLSSYILRLKMEKAEKLLTESNKKVHEIAELLGYDNSPYFIKVFKKHFGWTPKEFRGQTLR